MLQKNTRLEEHYNSKYTGSSYEQVKKIPIVKNPIDRFQMAVKMLSKEKGKYLEIGLASVT